MAGDWIKWQKGLARKPEVMQIAARLGRSRHEIAGLLMEVWEWADDNAVVRDVSGSEPDACPGYVLLGDQSEQLLDALAGAAGLAAAMTAVGWLQTRNGSLVFPNFGRHNGKTAKARALDSSRKRQTRTASAPGPIAVRTVSGCEPDKTRTREEKSREEKKGRPPNPPRGSGAVPIPPELDTPEFRTAWADWLADRKARRKGVTERAAALQLDKLAPLGPAKAAASIRESIEKGWSGLFPRDEPPPATKPTAADRMAADIERGKRYAEAQQAAGGRP